MRIWTWLVALTPAIAAFAACSQDTFTTDAGLDTGADTVLIGGEGGAGDAHIDAVTSTPRFCEKDPKAADASFCADFDIPGDAAAGFAGLGINGAFNATFENTQYMSKPTAFEVDIPTDGGGGGAVLGILVGADAGAQTSLVLDVDIYLPAISNNTPSIFMFQFGTIGNNTTEYGLAENSGVWMLSNAQGGVAALSLQPASGGWAHVQLTINPTTSTTGSATIVITSANGTSVGSFNNLATTTLPTPPYPAILNLGVINGTSGIKVPQVVYYDNVVVHLL